MTFTSNLESEVHDKNLAMKVSWVSIAVNFILSLIKLIVGIFSCSGALISDAIHSASDVFSTVVVMIGVNAARQKPDKEHPFGHERMECVASIVLAVLLAVTGLGIGYDGVKHVISGVANDSIPGVTALVIAILSVFIKEIMFQYTRSAAISIHSDALMADAWHHRSDALSSIAAFAGILGARMGYPLLDPLAAVVICGFIVKAAFDIFVDAMNKIVDHSCSDEIEGQMRNVIMSIPDVKGIDDLKTRLFGSKIYVEVEILMDADMKLISAHRTAEKVHSAIENQFNDVKHCMVHVNPDRENSENLTS